MKRLLVFRSHLFHLCPEVPEPDVTSFVLADNTPVEPGCSVADIGTGTGFLAMLAASKARKVVGTDISIAAIGCARANSVLNCCEDRVEFRQGDLLEPLARGKFDLVVANLPQMPTPPSLTRSDWMGLADNGGTDGRALIDAFIDRVADFLVPGGTVCLGQFGFLGVQRTLNRLSARQLEPAVHFRTKIPVGRLTWERLDYIRSIGLPVEVEEREGRVFHDLVMVVAKRQS